MRCELGALERFELLAPAYSPAQLYGSAAFHLRQCGVTPERIVEIALHLGQARA